MRCATVPPLSPSPPFYHPAGLDREDGISASPPLSVGTFASLDTVQVNQTLLTTVLGIAGIAGKCETNARR